MTAYSQNSYSANDRTVIARYALPGGEVALRAGDVSVVLLWVANRFHDLVEPLKWPGIWGFAERLIRGSTTELSNHASGTALDLDAPEHPLGIPAVRTFSSAEIEEIHAIVDACDGVVRWGGDYDNPARGGRLGSRPDPMHFEINAGAAAVKAVADKIRNGSIGLDDAPAPAQPSPRPRHALMEDDDMILEPAPSGRSHTIGVPAGATELVISLGWMAMRVDSVAFFGGAPATGVAQLWRSSNAQIVDPARPWPIKVPPGAVTAEINYVLPNHPGIEVYGTAFFRS